MDRLAAQRVYDGSRVLGLKGGRDGCPRWVRLCWRMGCGAVVSSALVLGCVGSDGPGDSESHDIEPTDLEYCDVAPIIEEYCLRCHSDPPEHAAPFPLTTYEATQDEYSGDPIWQRMEDAVAIDFMPLMLQDADPPVEPLPEDEKALLLEWLRGGAPQGDDCQ